MTKILNPDSQFLAAFGALKPHEKPAVGGFTKAFRSMHPTQAKDFGQLVQALHQDRSLGRHSNRDAIIKHVGVNPVVTPLLDRIVDAYEVDDLATSLQQRMGTDDSLPSPEVTRRDVLSAAFDNQTLLQGE